MAGQAQKHIIVKDTLVTGLQTDLKKSQGVIFLDYTGLTVKEVESLRRKMRAAKVQYRVVKNTLMKRALMGTPGEGATQFLKGTPTSVVFGFDDPVGTAKLTFDFMKDNEHLKVKGGLLDQKPLNAKETEALSKMPSRLEILAGIVGMALGPGRRLLAQIKSPAGKIVGQIDRFAEKGLDKTA